MAIESQGFTISMKAAGDYTAKQYYAVEVSAADTVSVCNAATDRTFGILQNTPYTGQAASVCVSGISKAVSDGSGTNIAVGDYVGPNSSGKMIKKATADYNVTGIALGASAADGTVISVLLTPGAFWRSAAG